MSKKNFLSGKEKELFQLAERYEKSRKEGSSIYLDADDWADLADWYATRNRKELANETAQKGLQQHPNHTGLLVEQAYLFIDTYQMEKAEQVANCIEEDYLPEVKILKANLLMQNGEFEEAEKILKELEDKAELSDIIEITYLLLEQGRIKEAWSWLEKAEDYENETAYQGVLGDFYLATKQYKNALKVYDQLIDRNPYSAPFWYAAARCYLAMEVYDKAIEACDFAIVADEEFGEAYLVKASVFAQLDNDEKAQENYLLAYKYGAVSEDFYLTYEAGRHIDQMEWKEACECLTKVLEIDPIETVPVELVYSKLALCLHKLGSQDEALTYCKEAEELNPDDIENYFVEASIQMALGNKFESEEAWMKALDLEPTANTWVRIAQTCEDFARIDMARKAYERAEQLNPSLPGLYEHMAMIYLLQLEKDRFLLYNSRCEKPISIQQVKEIQCMLQKHNSQEALQIIQDILASMQKTTE